GPAGTGKPTLAASGAKRANARFVAISAVASGVAELRKLIQESRKLRELTDQRTVLFIDEIHRFNKAQQDVVLPYAENGDVILLGATTETPSFEVNSALLSRSRVFTLKPLAEDEIRTIVRRALADERGLAGTVALAADAEDALVAVSNGDARVALNALELAADAATVGADGKKPVGLAEVRAALQRRARPDVGRIAARPRRARARSGGDACRPGPSSPAERADAPHGRAGLRPGLQVRARLRRSCRARGDLPAGLARGPPLLRADGPRRGSGAQDAARGAPAKRAKNRPSSKSRYI